MTYNQSHGKGQLGAKWQTQAEKNICMSFICYPGQLRIGNQFLLSMTAALAVMRFLMKYSNKTIKIKWPNDILIDNRKICGILINNSIQGTYITSSVIGMGVNINQSEFGEELPSATSLLKSTLTEYDLDELSAELYHSLSAELELLNKGQYAQIRNQYHEHLFGMNERIHFQRRDLTEFYGEIIGVDEDGRLMVKTETGIEKFDIREIKPIL